MRRTAGRIKWDHKRNEEVLQELNMDPAIEYTQHYQHNWKSYPDRMNDGWIPKEILKYQLRSTSFIGFPIKRWTVTGLMA